MLLPYLNKDLIEAGCDEAGRGCLAGSVFAAAVILPHKKQNSSWEIPEPCFQDLSTLYAYGLVLPSQNSLRTGAGRNGVHTRSVATIPPEGDREDSPKRFQDNPVPWGHYTKDRHLHTPCDMLICVPLLCAAAWAIYTFTKDSIEHQAGSLHISLYILSSIIWRSVPFHPLSGKSFQI